MINEVIVDQKREPGMLWFQINWQTGAATQYTIERTCSSYRDHSEVEKIKQRVGELNEQGLTAKRIAEMLNAEGLRTTYRESFNYRNIKEISHTENAKRFV